LSWKLRGDSRVSVLERFNARELAPGVLPYAPEVIVADLAFISLRTVLGSILSCAAPRFDALCLVKPQFEVGRGRVGRGGVVRDGTLRRAALLDVAAKAEELGASVRGFFASGLPGPKGNIETFVALAERERGSLGALDALALAADPG
jgi:23S rRNA (cytidine1920-2'-O)/16S rRNA (cytidine1409-2'-O)-methyltransferase